MDSVQFKKYYTAVKNFLLGPKNKEFLIFLFFFFVSAAFWLLQSLNETFDVELKVPLKLENVPSDVVITSDLPSDLNVMVRDKGTVLVRYIYGTEQVPVRVDYKDYDKGNASGRVSVTLLDLHSFTGSLQAKGVGTDFLSPRFLIKVLVRRYRSSWPESWKPLRSITCNGWSLHLIRWKCWRLPLFWIL